MTADSAALEKARKLLCALQAHIRDAVIASRARHARTFAQVAAVTAADTIYRIDRISEAAIFEWFAEHWPKVWPVELVMEGIADGEVVTFPRGTPVGRTIFKVILDPIDGTRGLMYDKRSAWILAGLAPQRGARNTLADIVVAAMTELPSSKQVRSDQISAVRGRGLRTEAYNLSTRRRSSLTLRPSQAKNFHHGFASIARFFPDGKALLAKFEEELWHELYPDMAGSAGSPLIFDDQYISTGGQIYELLAGHDRMLGDLRPLAFAKLGLNSALVCHPYDICTALLLEEGGGFIEAPDGKPLRVPLDTTSPVAWMAYANRHLAKTVRPVLRRLLARHF